MALARESHESAALPRIPGLRRLFDSLIGKLLLLLLVFIALPIIVYREFEEADAEKRRLLLEAVREQGRLIAESMTPIMEGEDSLALKELPPAVERLATNSTGVKVLFRPSSEKGVEGFYFVASEPPLPPAALKEERDRLIERGVLDHLVGSCEGDAPVALRHRTADGGVELLTSITPVTTTSGCWAIVTAHTGGAFLGTSIGQPYWRTLEIEVAAAIYLALALMTFVLFAVIWRNLMRFRETARAIREGEWPQGGFAAENRVPELAAVAEEFDNMTRALRQSAEDLRRAAEDNAHAFKTPIAILRQSLEPLQRSIPGEDARGRRALEVIETAVDRLDHLVTTARRLDETLAELIDPPRRPIDLSRLVERLLESYAEPAARSSVTFEAEISRDVVVRGGEELLETVIENVIDNALEVSPPGSTIGVRLERKKQEAVLQVRDEGPGVPAPQLEWIFERYASLRNLPRQQQQAASAAQQGGQHLGIGLWIVRRNLEAVGGEVRADNGREGGLIITIRIPLAL